MLRLMNLWLAAKLCLLNYLILCLNLMSSLNRTTNGNIQVYKLQKKERRMPIIYKGRLSIMLKLKRERIMPSLKSYVKNIQYAIRHRRLTTKNLWQNIQQNSQNDGDSKALLLLILLILLLPLLLLLTLFLNKILMIQEPLFFLVIQKIQENSLKQGTTLLLY